MIRSDKGARTGLVDLEEMSDEDLEKLEDEFWRLHKRHNHNHGRDEKETGRKREASKVAGQKTSGRRSS